MEIILTAMWFLIKGILSKSVAHGLFSGSLDNILKMKMIKTALSTYKKLRNTSWWNSFYKKTETWWKEFNLRGIFPKYTCININIYSLSLSLIDELTVLTRCSAQLRTSQVVWGPLPPLSYTWLPLNSFHQRHGSVYTSHTIYILWTCSALNVKNINFLVLRKKYF